MKLLIKNIKWPHFFLVAFLITGLLPTFGAIDKVGSQWLYLSLLNVIFFIFISFIPFDFKLKHFFSLSIVRTFVFFIIVIFISFFLSTNKASTIISISRWLTVFFSFFSFSILLANTKNFAIVISYILSIVLLFELFYIYSSYFEILSVTNYSYQYATYLKGVTGNKNVAASILALKIPFVLYALYYSKSLRLKVLLATIFIFGFYALLLVNSRTILLTLIICTIIFVILSVFSKKFSLLKWLIIPFTTILVFISNPFNEFSSFSLNQDRITFSDASTTARLDYYKLAWDYFIDHPIIGVGLANWKIESLAFQNKLMKDYTVSYHVHNDFLELAVELGLFGVLAYLLLFAFGFRTVYLLRKNIFFLFLGASLLIYFVDSMLNFPMSRVSDQIMFVLLMAFFVSPNSSINENS